MSELTQCNFCSFRILKSNLKKGYKIKMEPNIGMLGGNNVFKYPDHIHFNELTRKNKSKYFVSWFMELTDHCVC